MKRIWEEAGMTGWYAEDDDACTVSIAGDVVVVVGELDQDTDFLLRDVVTGALAGGPRSLVADLSGLTFLSAGSVTLLLALQRAAAEAGCRLTVTGVTGTPARVLAIAGVLDLLAGAPAGPGGAGCAEEHVERSRTGAERSEQRPQDP